MVEMVRPRRFRRVLSEPDVTFFKPAGIRLVDLEEIVISVDEFEAVRLKDLNGLEQSDCAKKMNISQPTFHRLILSTRKKLAEAIVKGKAIRIEGGHFQLSSSQKTCVCHDCGFSVPKERGKPCFTFKCPECSGRMVWG